MNLINAVVTDRKIEIEAPSELPDGSQVTVLLVAKPTISSDPMTRDEIGRRLQAMDLFVASFQANENGEDLSQAAREVGEQELTNFAENTDRLARFFN